MRSKISAFTLFLFASCLVPAASFATTLTLESTDSGIYPYAFEINGSPTLTNLSCINDSRSVHVGETWTVNAVNVGTLVTANTSKGVVNLNAIVDSSDSLSLGALEVDANLDALYITNPKKSNYTVNNTEVQDAIWSVLQGSLVTTGLTWSQQNVENTMITNAVNTVTSGKDASSFYSAFTFYIPTSWGARDTTPQQFLGYCPITPEPSSLILMGTGLAGLAGAVRRRIKSARQQDVAAV